MPGAINIPLAELSSQANKLDSQRATAVICAGGYRSTIATGLLAQKGFKQIFNVVGGTATWINAGYAVESVATAATS